MKSKINGKIAVIDIGSNSVRLMMSDSGRTLYKRIEITRLSQNMSDDGKLNEKSVERTVSAVLNFYEIAKSEGAEKILAFATACCRNAVNGREFAEKIYKLIGLEIDIVDGQTEALIGFLGATNGKDGGVIDIGGASTEIIVQRKGEIKYSKSVNVGVVKIFEYSDNKIEKAREFIDEKVLEFGVVPSSEFFAIGGTATSIASVLQELEPYDREKVHGFTINYSDLITLEEKLYKMSVEEKRNLKGLQPARAEVVGGGVTLLIKVMQKLNVNRLTVSESDNLEGYLIKYSECL